MSLMCLQSRRTVHHADSIYHSIVGRVHRPSATHHRLPTGGTTVSDLVRNPVPQIREIVPPADNTQLQSTDPGLPVASPFKHDESDATQPFTGDLGTLIKLVVAMCDYRGMRVEDLVVPTDEQGNRDPRLEAFLRMVIEHRDAIDSCSDLNLESFVSTSFEKLNQWLAQRGMTSVFSPIQPGKFGATAFSHIKKNWLTAGKVTTLTAADGKQYPAFKVKVDHDGAFVCRIKGIEQPIFGIRTERGGYRFFVESLDRPKSSLDMAVVAQRIKKEGNPCDWDDPFSSYTHLVAPQIDLRTMNSYSWLVKFLRANGFPTDEVLQELLFQMDENGFEAKIASSSIPRGAIVPQEENPYVIRNGFLSFYVPKSDSGLYVPAVNAVYVPVGPTWKRPQRALSATGDQPALDR